MTRTAWFAGALGIITVAIAAVVWRAIDTYQPTPVVETERAAMPVLALGVQRADRIQIVRGGDTLNLERRGQVWGLAQKGGYPVKSAMADRLLDQLLALRLDHPSITEHTEVRVDEPREAKTGLTGIRVLATNGAGLGALIVADHDPAALSFSAHQLGDPRDWRAAGALNAPADPMAWVDTHILTLDPARVAGASLQNGAGSFTLDAAAAAARLSALQAMAFTDVHPAAQIPAVALGRVVFALKEGGALTVTVRMLADQVWLAITATAPDVTNIAAGEWVFRYPADAASLLRPPA